MPQLTVTKCSECPLYRDLGDGRGVCTDAATAHDVKRGHWEVSTDCIEKLEALETEEEIAPTTPKSTPEQIEAAEVLNAFEEVWGNGRIYNMDEISDVSVTDGLVTIAFTNGLVKTFAQSEYDYLLLVNEPELEIDYAAELKKRAKASDYGESFLNAFIYQESDAERDYLDLTYLERVWWDAIMKVENSQPGSEQEQAAYLEVDKAEQAIARFTRSLNTPCLA